MTSPLILAALLALAAVAVAAAAGWLAAGLVSRWLLRAPSISAPTRAALAAQARLLPLALIAVLVPAQIAGFARFEAGGPESAGPLLLALALCGLVLLGDALRSGIRAWRQTDAVVRAWQPSAQPFALPGWPHRAWRIAPRYPVVAVVGVSRPELFVAAQVAEHCTPPELAAIVAHEAAHVAARDNLLRLLFHLTPGAGLAAAIARPLEQTWMAAAEEAADARARAATSGLDLASALTKVARLAVSRECDGLPASTLIGGHDLQSRVRHLLEPPAPAGRAAVRWAPAALLGLAAAVVHATPALAGLHEVFELLVRR